MPGARASFAAGGGAGQALLSGRLLEDARVLAAFEPQWTVRRGVEQLAHAYDRHGLSFEEFTGTRYLRINRVRELQAGGRLDDELRWRLPVATG